MDRKDRILPNFAIFFRSFLLIQKWNYPQNAGNFQSVFQNFPFFFHPKTEYAAFFRSFLLTQKWNLPENAGNFQINCQNFPVFLNNKRANALIFQKWDKGPIIRGLRFVINNDRTLAWSN